MQDFMAVMRALGEENRARTVMALRGRELCVCQIVELLQLAPSTVSKHMAVLRQAGVVEGRKEGRWMYYRLAEGPDTPPAVRDAVTLTFQSLANDRQVREDAQRLGEIIQMDPEELCRRQEARRS